MISPADVTALLLVQLGLGTDPTAGGSWPVYVSSEPTAPDNVITVYDTDGTDSGRDMNSGEVFRFHGVQVRVRARDHATGWAKAKAITTAMEQSVYLTVVANGAERYLVHAYDSISDPIALGRETPTSSRRVFTANALMTYRQLV